MGRVAIVVFALTVGSVLATAQGRQQKGDAMALHLESPAFQPGGAIPKEFACEGPDHSPALQWSNAPENTRSFVLIVDDPDAPVGTWVHWVVYDLPAGTKSLPQGVSKSEKLQGGGVQGKNDFKRIGYGGPCPPPGKPHRYFFKLYALDTELNLKPGAKKAEIEQAMHGHILANAELMGTYGR